MTGRSHMHPGSWGRNQSNSATGFGGSSTPGLKCQYPLWDDVVTHEYCERPTLEGKPYCPEHYIKTHRFDPMTTGEKEVKSRPEVPTRPGAGRFR